jgi:hypothetical protein
MLFSLCWFLLLSVLGTQAAENAGTKMVIRNTFGSHPSYNTTYWVADRRRTEFTRAVQRTKEDGSVEWVDEVTSVFIVRCDLGQSFTLNMKAEEYSVAEYPPKRLTPEEMAARGINTPVAPQPTLRIETTTVDTGERKELFGHVARHVITTAKQIPLEGSHTQAQETVRDGWYIDVDRTISCEPKLPAGTVSGFVMAGAVVGGKEMMMERPEFVNIGARETGIPVKETRTTTSEAAPATGVRRYSDSTNESEVTHFEEGLVDPALFEVPPGFKRAERSQRNSSE